MARKTDIALTDFPPMIFIKAQSKKSLALFPHMFQGCKDETAARSECMLEIVAYFKGQGFKVSYNGVKI